MDICDLQSFVDCLEDSVVVIDEDYRVVLANAAALRTSGLTAEEVLDHACYAVFHGQTVPCANQPCGDCAVRTVRVTGQPARVRHHHPDANGSDHVVEIYASPLPGREPGSALVVELMHEITRQAELEIEREHLFQTLQERARSLEEANLRLHALEQARRRALQRAMTAQEDERRRIAAELHDDTAQGLAALIVGMDTAVAMLQHSPDATREQLAHLKRSTSAMIEDIDTIIAALRPALLDDLGLLPALRAYAAERLDPLGVAWEFEAPCNEWPLPSPVEMALFRVVQEAINNIARHAQAHQVHITISPEADEIMVQVSDDGVGFDLGEHLDPSRRPPSLGLLGMQERLAAVEGRLQIRSIPGQGTQLCICVPIAADGGPT